MKKLVIVLLLIVLAAGCTPRLDVPQEPVNIIIGTPKDEIPEDKTHENAFVIRDHRAEKTSLAGKYSRGLGSSDNCFEIFEEYAMLSTGLDKDDSLSIDPYPSKHRYTVISEVEGFTWICFSFQHERQNSLNFYSVDDYIFILEDYIEETPREFSAYYPEGFGIMSAASEFEQDLLFLDTGSISLDKTFEKTVSDYPDLRFTNFIDGGAFFRSDSLGGILVFSADMDPSRAHNPDPYDKSMQREAFAAVDKDAKPLSFGTAAMYFFPNMGPRIFVQEICHVTGGPLKKSRDSYGFTNVSFKYHEYTFWYMPDDTFDISYYTTMFISGDDDVFIQVG